MSSKNKTEPYLEPMSPCGSLAFVPPETLEQKGSFAGDWWGLGVIAFELFTGHFPWSNVQSNDDDALRNEIRSGRVDMPSFLSAGARSLLSGLLEKDVEERLGFFARHQVRSHPFFMSIDWKLVEAQGYDPPYHPCRVNTKKKEAVVGLRNFAQDQRKLAMDSYVGHKCKDKEPTTRDDTATAVKTEARCTDPSRKDDLPAMFRDIRPVRLGGYPVYRGFELAPNRPAARDF